MRDLEVEERKPFLKHKILLYTPQIENLLLSELINSYIFPGVIHFLPLLDRFNTMSGSCTELVTSLLGFNATFLAESEPWPAIAPLTEISQSIESSGLQKMFTLVFS